MIFNVKIRLMTSKTDQITDYREHWHTNHQPFMDAQFSSDGNGIVSGGQECVAVYTLWKGGEELRRNFVPRLDAPIGTVLPSFYRKICCVMRIFVKT